MNELEKFLAGSRITWQEAMNLLQQEGIVSDNCDGPADVAVADCRPAVEFLSLFCAAMADPMLS